MRRFEITLGTLWLLTMVVSLARLAEHPVMGPGDIVWVMPYTVLGVLTGLYAWRERVHFFADARSPATVEIRFALVLVIVTVFAPGLVMPLMGGSIGLDLLDSAKRRQSAFRPA